MTRPRPTKAEAKRECIVTLDLVAGSKEAKRVELTLPPNMTCVEQRTTKDGWSATFKLFDEECILRQRDRGTIECEAVWVKRRSGRERTGTYTKSVAIEWASKRMLAEHARQLENGPVLTESNVDPDDLRLSDMALVLRENNLIPGRPGTKTRKGYEFVLDLALAIWDDDPREIDFDQSHIDKMYAVRCGDDEDAEPFVWPNGFDHRRRLGLARPQTVQGDLVDLCTLFNRLLGRRNKAGKRLLRSNPLDGLALGDYSKRMLPEAGPLRYRYVLAVAELAEKRLREAGVHWVERRWYNNTEWRTYDRCQVFPGLVPGMLRHMLVTAYGHGMRPNSWRHLAVADVARSYAETHRLLRSLQLEKHDELIRPEWARIWIHGAYAYRRKWFKGRRGRRYERGVPLSEPMGREHDGYVEQRAAWLKDHGLSSPWLFPSPRDPSEPVSEEDARLMLEFAEQVAREVIAASGLDPDELVPELEDTAWYAYRRAWKTLRNEIGWEGNKNSAYVGGWSTRVGAIADTIYARFSPHLVLAVVEGLSLPEAIARLTELDDHRQAVDVSPTVPADLKLPAFVDANL